MARSRKKQAHDHRGLVTLPSDGPPYVIECECGERTEPADTRGEAEIRWLDHCRKNGVDHDSEEAIAARAGPPLELPPPENAQHPDLTDDDAA